MSKLSDLSAAGYGLFWSTESLIEAKPSESLVERISGVVKCILSHPDELVIKTLLISSGMQSARQYSSASSISKAAWMILPSLWTNMAHAEPTFLETLGGTAGETPVTDLMLTADGGLLISGQTSSFGQGSYDVFLAKRWNNGTLAWAEVVGENLEDQGGNLASTLDGGVVIAGRTNNFGAGDIDVFFAKLDANGVLEWARTLGGVGHDSVEALLVTSEQQFIVAGQTFSFGAGSADLLLAKWESNGTLAWARTLGGAGYDQAFVLATTTDGGLVTAGQTLSFGAGNWDMWTSKWWTNGTLEWVRTCGGTGNDGAYGLTSTPDGGVIVAGTTTSFGASLVDMLLTKWESNGELTWAKMWGTSGSDEASDVTFTLQGDVAFVGFTNLRGGGDINDIFLAKCHANGTFIWAKLLGGESDDRAYCLIEAESGDLILGGQTTSFGAGGYHALIARTTKDGEMPNCNYLQNISPNISAITASVTIPNVSEQIWDDPSVMVWNGPTVTKIDPSHIVHCSYTTTGQITTGQITTGQITTGVEPQPPGVTGSASSTSSGGTQPPARSTNTDIVVGVSVGAVGALTCIAGLGTAVFLLVKRNRAKANQVTSTELSSAPTRYPAESTPSDTSTPLEPVPHHPYENLPVQPSKTPPHSAQHQYENLPGSTGKKMTTFVEHV